MDDELLEIFLSMNDKKDMKQLFMDLLTPAEMDNITLRWKLVKDLHQGMPQRKIAEKYKISLCKITRGSKILKQKESIVLKVLDRASCPE